ncbi:hypothetical protein HGG76_06155 [Ochrobactrum tritici]|uniref:Uncharacterized protein n=1 Tax=Brucella tritici TaxID=94626 RepID=A0A7X6FPG8_9HYPH|nr:hypothetical protein [Brucella tritici]
MSDAHQMFRRRFVTGRHGLARRRNSYSAIETAVAIALYQCPVFLAQFAAFALSAGSGEAKGPVFVVGANDA